jgi:hypothetical protein
MIEVVLWVRWLHLHLHQKSQRTAAQLSSPPNIINTNYLYNLRDNDSKRSRDNRYCTWLDSYAELSHAASHGSTEIGQPVHHGKVYPHKTKDFLAPKSYPKITAGRWSSTAPLTGTYLGI